MAFFLAFLVTRGRIGLLVLAALLAFFSLDDIVAAHERIGTIVREDVLGLPTGWGRVLWPLVFLSLLATTALTLWRVGGAQLPRIGDAIRTGLGAHLVRRHRGGRLGALT